MGVRVIYADVFFLINFTVDFMCLYITRALMSAHAALWRTVTAAALGAAYSVAWAVLPYVPPYALIPAHICAALAMSFVMLGKRGFGRVCAGAGIFALSAALVGGVLGAAFSLAGGGYVVSGGAYAEISPLFLLAVAAVSVGACYVYGVFCRRKIAAASVKMVMTVNGKEYAASLFVDTGCHVVDPLTGELVIIVSARVFGGEVPRTTRIIPFSGAGGSRVLYGFRPAFAVINGNAVDTVVAVSGKDEYYRGCDGLVPPVLALGKHKEEAGIC